MNIIAPTSCPSCGSTLERVNDQLFCRNSTECPAQTTKKLQNFCKKLKINGFGEATLEKLGITDILELLNLTEEYFSKAGFSDKMSSKLYAAIEDKLSRGISPNEFLAALSIPLIGDGAMRKLKFAKIGDITYDMCKNAGIGDKAATNLMQWINNNWDEYCVFEPFFEAPKQLAPSNNTAQIAVCITGKLNDYSNRKDAADFLAQYGIEVKSSVTKAVKYLVCEDDTKRSSSSYKKALTNNIKIVTIKELLEDIYV